MTGTPAEVLADCEAHGIRLALADGGGLEIDAPQEALTPERLARLKAHKAGLLALLRPALRPAGPTTPAAEADLPGWAAPSGWVELAGGVLVQTVRPEAASLDWNGLDEPGEPCGCCGSLDKWEDYNGRRHCGRCEAATLDRARRLTALAAEVRRRNPPGPKPTRRPDKIPRGGAWQRDGNPV